MALSEKAAAIAAELAQGSLKSGDVKKRASEIKVDQELALELWSTGDYRSRLLATLIFDKKLISEPLLDQLAADMQSHPGSERDQLTDWFLANQLTKDKKLTALMTTWENHPSPILRRLFWYHQARLRWTGQAPPGNTAALLDSLEKNMADAEPGVQWAMNFCACQVAVNEPAYRERCVELGERLGLYKGDHVSKNCTPSYLPDFVRIEVAKRA